MEIGLENLYLDLGASRVNSWNKKMNKLFSSDPAIQMKLYIVETTCVFLYKMAMAF